MHAKKQHLVHRTKVISYFIHFTIIFFVAVINSKLFSAFIIGFSWMLHTNKQQTDCTYLCNEKRKAKGKKSNTNIITIIAVLMQAKANNAHIMCGHRNWREKDETKNCTY